MITKTQAKLIAALLERAARTFANHGCSDLDVAACGLTEEQSDELRDEYHRHNGDPDVAPDFYGCMVWPDWQLMSYFAAMLERLAEQPVSEAPASNRDRQLFADGMETAIGIMRSRSLVFMPYGSIGCFADAITRGDPVALWYLEQRYTSPDPWPPDLPDELRDEL